jgi:hypothetical protein
MSSPGSAFALWNNRHRQMCESHVDREAVAFNVTPLEGSLPKGSREVELVPSGGMRRA